jgi:probable rRNA maturation factor
MIEVTVIDQQQDRTVDAAAVEIFVQQAVKAIGCQAHEVSVALVDEEQIRAYNRTYRGRDQVTDVLSFGLDNEPDPDGRVNLGDLVICPARADEQAATAGHSLWTEMQILLLHGLLHLSGMDHPEHADDREEGPSDMERAEHRLRGQLIEPEE